MMPSRMQTIDLDVKHVGDPCEGMPISSVGGRECPEDTLEAESSVDVWVLEHIDIVIEVDESMVSNLPEGCQGQ
jgi:hypothetical protein